MPDLRPSIEREQVLTLLHQHFSEPVTNLSPLEGSQVARTFAFRAGKQEYILRFNAADHMPISFAKEAFLARTIASPQIPIPPVTQVGRWQNLHFAISQRVPGQMVEKLPVQEVGQLVPSLLAILHAIHQVDVSRWKNYGVFDEQGTGLYPDWHSSLVRVKDEEEDWDYFGKWHHLFDDTFLERDLFDDLFRRFVSVDGREVAAMDHDVADGDVAQIQDRVQHRTRFPFLAAGIGVQIDHRELGVECACFGSERVERNDRRRVHAKQVRGELDHCVLAHGHVVGQIIGARRRDRRHGCG